MHISLYVFKIKTKNTDLRENKKNIETIIHIIIFLHMYDLFYCNYYKLKRDIHKILYLLLRDVYISEKC